MFKKIAAIIPVLILLAGLATYAGTMASPPAMPDALSPIIDPEPDPEYDQQPAPEEEQPEADDMEDIESFVPPLDADEPTTEYDVIQDDPSQESEQCQKGSSIWEVWGKNDFPIDSAFNESSRNTMALFDFLTHQALSPRDHGGLFQDVIPEELGINETNLHEYIDIARWRGGIWVVNQEAVDIALASYTGDMTGVTVIFREAGASLQDMLDLTGEIGMWFHTIGNPVVALRICERTNMVLIGIPYTDDGSIRNVVDRMVAESNVPPGRVFFHGYDPVTNPDAIPWGWQN